MFKILSSYICWKKYIYIMQHLEGSGAPVLYIGRTVLKGCPITCKAGIQGGTGITISILDLGLRREWVVSATAALPAGKNRYPLDRRLDGPRCGDGWAREPRLHRGSDLRTVQDVAKRYTSSDRAGEPFWERMPKLSINFEEILSHAARGNFGEKIRSWSLR
jgi:hypothetical protein